MTTTQPEVLSNAEEKEFNDAVKLLDSIEQQVCHNNATAAIMLRLYGLYKQKMEGDIMESMPSPKDIVRVAKFQSWKSLEGMSKKKATILYISVVQQLVKQTEIAQNQRRERAETTWKMLAILIAFISIMLLLHYHEIEILPSLNHVESMLGLGLVIVRSTAEQYRMKFDLYQFSWNSEWVFGWMYLQRMFTTLPYSFQSFLGMEQLLSSSSSSSVSITKDKKHKTMYGSLEYTPSSHTYNQINSIQSGNLFLVLLQLLCGIYLLTTLWLYNTKQRRIAFYQRLSDFFAYLFRFCFTTNNNVTTNNSSPINTTTISSTTNIPTSNVVASNTTITTTTTPAKASYSPTIRSSILLAPTYFAT